MQIDANMLNNPQAMQNFEKAQGALSGALSRLMVVAERYPDLKSNQNFLTLQSQLEGTENRIAIARKDYIASVQGFNTEIRTFPGRLWYSIMYSDLAAYEAYQATTEGAQAAPQVQF
jgi:LemA protein